MPIGVLNPQILSPEQANPFGYGFQQGANIHKILAEAEVQRQNAEKLRQLMPFLAPTAQAELTGLQQKNQWNPRIWQSEIGLRGAQAGLAGSEADKIRFMLSHPGLLGGETSKEIEGLRLLGANVNLNQMQGNGMNNAPQNAGQPSSSSSSTAPFQTGNQLIDSILNRKYARSAYEQKMTEGYNWSHLPVETRNQLTAQGYGMGIDPVRMMDYVNRGMNLRQIAENEGLDPENLPSPIYPPTTATKTRVQQVQQVGNELDYLSSAATALIKPYADTFAGFSPQRISDMLSNNPEAQKRFGRYIGALSVQTGIATGRVLLEGGRAGLEVMRMVKDSSLKGIDQHSPVKMTQLGYEEAQKTIDQLLQRGSKIRTTTGMNPFSEVGKSRKSSDEKFSGNGSGTIKLILKGGKLVEE